MNSHDPLNALLEEDASIAEWFAERRRHSRGRILARQVAAGALSVAAYLFYFFSDASPPFRMVLFILALVVASFLQTRLRSSPSLFPHSVGNLLERNDRNILIDLWLSGVNGQQLLFAALYEVNRRSLVGFLFQTTLCLLVWIAVVAIPTAWLGRLYWPHFFLILTGCACIMRVRMAELTRPSPNTMRVASALLDRWVATSSDAPLTESMKNAGKRIGSLFLIAIACTICLPFLFLILRFLFMEYLLPLWDSFPVLGYRNGYGSIIMAGVVAWLGESYRSTLLKAPMWSSDGIAPAAKTAFDSYIRRVILKDPDWSRDSTP